MDISNAFCALVGRRFWLFIQQIATRRRQVPLLNSKHWHKFTHSFIFPTTRILCHIVTSFHQCTSLLWPCQATQATLLMPTPQLVIVTFWCLEAVHIYLLVEWSMPLPNISLYRQGALPLMGIIPVQQLSQLVPLAPLEAPQGLRTWWGLNTRTIIFMFQISRYVISWHLSSKFKSSSDNWTLPFKHFIDLYNRWLVFMISVVSEVW